MKVNPLELLSDVVITIKNLNINVKLYLITISLYSIIQTPMYISTFFLVYILGGENLDAGTIFGLGGLAGIIGLIISGIFSDKWRRDVFIWLSYITLSLSAFFLWKADSFSDLIIVQVLQSFGFSLFQPAGSAIIADCTRKGERTKIYTMFSVFTQISVALGGVGGFFIYKQLGDTFQYSTIMPVIRISIIIMLIAGLPLLFINDKRSLSAADHEESIKEKIKDEQILARYRSCKTFKDKIKFYRTPIIIVFADFVIAFGAGMIIPFLPRFFQQIYNKSLSELTLIFSTAPIITAILSTLLLSLGKKIGRARAIFIIEFVAVILLFSYAFYPPFTVVLIIYILREATMNSGWPLISAIVMDILPKNQRATFSAIDSLAFTAFNRASQPIGGKILDSSGFKPAFIITGSIYLIGVFSLLFIKEGNYEEELDTEHKNKVEITSSEKTYL